MRKNFIRLIACYIVWSFSISNLQGQVYNGSLTLVSQEQVDAFNYTSVTGSLIIQEVSAGNITNLNGLSELTSIEGDLTIGFGLNGNTALANLDGLSNLTSVGWTVSISRNSALQNIAGLSKLISIGQSLSIINNSVLSNLDGLLGIRSLQSLYIENNPVSNINGLMNLTSV